MADLVTHVCIGLLPAVFYPRVVVPLALGCALPDISGRVPQMAVAILELPLPEELKSGMNVVHTPLAQVLVCGMVAQLFHPRDRRFALGGLLAGAALHFALDVLQNHHGNGYYLLFPFSVSRYELEWIGSEATVDVAPAVLGVTVLVWLLRAIWMWSRSRGRSPRS